MDNAAKVIGNQVSVFAIQDLSDKFQEASKRLKRGIVFAASLYLWCALYLKFQFSAEEFILDNLLLNVEVETERQEERESKHVSSSWLSYEKELEDKRREILESTFTIRKLQERLDRL